MHRVLIAALMLGATPVAADVRLELVMQGYSDLFKACQFDIEVFADDGYGDISYGYEIQVAGAEPNECEGRSTADGYNESSCSAAAQVEHTCEEFQFVRLKWLDCSDTSGQQLNCGSVSLTSPQKGMFKFPDD